VASLFEAVAASEAARVLPDVAEVTPHVEWLLAGC
jgi:hypothetical protein